VILLARRKNEIPVEKTKVEDPRRNKIWLYVAVGMTVVGAIMALIPTIIIITPGFDITFQNFYKSPYFYIFLAGLVILTAGFILHRKITPPMEPTETEQLKTRLE
jgi:hypothetical protein